MFNLHDSLEPSRIFVQNFNTNCPGPWAIPYCEIALWVLVKQLGLRYSLPDLAKKQYVTRIYNPSQSHYRLVWDSTAEIPTIFHHWSSTVIIPSVACCVLKALSSFHTCWQCSLPDILSCWWNTVLASMVDRESWASGERVLSSKASLHCHHHHHLHYHHHHSWGMSLHAPAINSFGKKGLPEKLRNANHIPVGQIKRGQCSLFRRSKARFREFW